MTHPTRVALVLGAGGTIGQAYHAGVIAALGEAGWDARRADLMVGTSAGSLMAAMLRAGISGADIAARALGRDMSPEAMAIARGARFGSPLPGPGLHQFDLRGGPASPRLLLRALLAPHRVRPAAAAAAVIPAGRVSTAGIEDPINQIHPTGWPKRSLWVCAVRLSDGHRVVFGRRGAPITTVGAAVAASCAIPAYFAPVRIAGGRYVDGGVHSVTNADLCATGDYDLVIAIAPMGATRAALGIDVGTLMRASVRARLGGELARVRAAGSQVMTFLPTAEDRAAMGPNAMDPRRRGITTRQARESTLRRLEDPELRQRLELLTSAA